MIYDHLICTPFPVGYTFWLYHGESRSEETRNVSHTNVVQDNIIKNPIQNMINDAFRVDRQHTNEVPIASM